MVKPEPVSAGPPARSAMTGAGSLPAGASAASTTSSAAVTFAAAASGSAAAGFAGVRPSPPCESFRFAIAGDGPSPERSGRTCRFLRTRLRHGAARGQFRGCRRGRPQILDVPNPGVAPARPAEEASARLRLRVLACRAPDRFDFPGFRLRLDSFRRPGLRARTVFVGEAIRIARALPGLSRKNSRNCMKCDDLPYALQRRVRLHLPQTRTAGCRASIQSSARINPGIARQH